jgi:hypothetical protein
LGDQIVNLRVGQVVGDPVPGFDSDVNSRMRTVVEVLNVLGIFDETHPAEVVVAFPT